MAGANKNARPQGHELSVMNKSNGQNLTANGTVSHTNPTRQRGVMRASLAVGLVWGHPD